jgi:hypothetical protein
MEMDNVIDYNFEIKTTIPSIAIKHTLEYCTPIINDIPIFNIKKKVVNIFKKKVDDTRIIIKPYYNITIQIEHPIKCFLNKQIKQHENFKKDDFVDIIIPKHESFNIVGLYIPSILLNYINTSFLNYFHSLSNTSILHSGKFGLLDFQSRHYTQSRINSINTKNTYNNIIWFINNEDALHKIHIINKYIKYTSQFYETNLLMVYKHLHNVSFTNYIKNQENMYNIFNSEFYYKSLNVKYDSIFKQFASFINYELANDPYANDYVFNHYKMYDDLQKILMFGISHPISKKILMQINKQQQSDNVILNYNILKFKKKLKYAKLSAISFKKFKTSDITQLSETQKKIVLLEFNNIKKYHQLINKQTDDYKLVASLYWAIDNGKDQLINERINELKKIIIIPKNLESVGEIIQNKKKINIICPHILYKAHLMLQPAKNDIKKSGYIRTNLINHYSMVVTSDGYFCKVCGELLAAADDEEIAKFIAGKRVSFVMEIDRLKTQIWKEVAHIVTSFVKFRYAVNYKHIINNITNVIRPEISDIELKLSKIKSNSKDNIKSLLSIYITTYTMALISNMIVKNYGNITFSIKPIKGGAIHIKKNGLITKKKKRKKYKSSYMTTSNTDIIVNDDTNTSKISKYIHINKPTIGGKIEKQQIILQNIINNALFIILRIKSIAINNSMSINTDSIKPMLIKAYQWTVKLKEVGVPDLHDNDINDKTIIFNNNNIYNYIKHILKLNNNKKYNINNILGRTWDQIKSDFQTSNYKSIYATANESKKWGNSMEIDYKYCSFKFLIEYVKNKLYDVYTVPYSSLLLEHDKKYAFIQKYELLLYNLYNRSVMRPFNTIKLKTNIRLIYNNFYPSNIKIDKYYDNNGVKHNFNIAIYQKANIKGVLSGSKKEYTSNQINKELSLNNVKLFNEFKYMSLIDYKCSICHVLMSQTKNKTIDRELKKKNDIYVFYKYFENICPKGELHNFNEQMCIKCKLTKTMFDNKGLMYYNKYLKLYIKIQQEKLHLEKKEIHKLTITSHIIPKHPTFPEWKINNSAMLGISQTFKIKYNVWINLGLSINKDYELIKKEKINPSTNLNFDINRLRNMQLFSYYIYVITQISIIKHYATISNLSYNLKEIMKKNKVLNLEKKLELITMNVPAKYKYYLQHTKQYITSNFLLHSISTIILDTYKNMNKLNMQISKDLINYILKGMLTSEMSISKPDLNNFKSAINIHENSDLMDLSIDSDVDGDQVHDTHVDVVNENQSIFDASDDDPDNQFSTGDLDIEQDEYENLLSNPMGF